MVRYVRFYLATRKVPSKYGTLQEEKSAIVC